MHLEERIFIFYRTRISNNILFSSMSLIIWGSSLQIDVLPFEHLLTANAKCKGLGKLVCPYSFHITVGQLVVDFLSGRKIYPEKQGEFWGRFFC